MLMQKETIYFYSWKKAYFEFSNFSLHPIVIDGKTYATNEHYFQVKKFKDYSYAEEIRNAPTPAKAKSMGLSRKFEIHNNWDEYRIKVMKDAVLAKFTQHSKLKELLLSTGDAILVEDSPTDTFWGIGKNRTGKNMLGIILMQVRELLRELN